MRLRIVLPKVKPEAITVPTRCIDETCGGRTFHLRQEVVKPLRDTVYQEVQAHRYPTGLSATASVNASFSPSLMALFAIVPRFYQALNSHGKWQGL